VKPASWRDYARCAGQSLNLMFPEDEAPPNSRDYLVRVDQLRKEFCWQCPVRTQCLRDGMIEEYGLWGGLTQEDRRRVTQMTCHCGEDIDPQDMLDRNRRHFCGKCRPILFDHSSKV
jgi:hypothetical protein